MLYEVITASFAAKPLTRAATDCQFPKPLRAKIGAAKDPTEARMLDAPSPARVKVQLRFVSVQIISEPMKIIVKARCTKS